MASEIRIEEAFPERVLKTSLPELPDDRSLYQLYDSSWFVHFPGMWAMVDYNFEMWNERLLEVEDSIAEVQEALEAKRIFLIQW